MSYYPYNKIILSFLGCQSHPELLAPSSKIRFCLSLSAGSRLSETADISAASLSVTSVLSDGSVTSLVRSPSHQHQSCPPSTGIRLNTSSNSAHSTSTGIGVQPLPCSQNYTLGAFSSFQSAAQIYSQRLNRPSSSRPGMYPTNVLESYDILL